MKDWLPADDVADFIVAAVDRVPLASFQVADRTGGTPQYHPRLMLALLIYCYANGLFSSRRIERATYRDIGIRFVAANLHPDHDTIAVFRRSNKAAFEAAFLQVLLLARESGLLDAACARLEAEAKAEAEAARPAYEAKQAAYEGKTGNRGRAPVPPDPTPPAERQSNLTDPDSSLMRRLERHEYRQAYNAQAVVCADGAQPRPGHEPCRDDGRCAEFRRHHPGDGEDPRIAEDRARRYRLCKRSRRCRAGGQEDRTVGGDRPDPTTPAL